MMFKDVTVEQPLAWVIGHEYNLHDLVWGEQDRVKPRLWLHGLTIARE